MDIVPVSRVVSVSSLWLIHSRRLGRFCLF